MKVSDSLLAYLEDAVNSDQFEVSRETLRHLVQDLVEFQRNGAALTHYRCGIDDCIKDVKRRRAFLEDQQDKAYRYALDEDLIMFEAMRERGCYSAKSVVDSVNSGNVPDNLIQQVIVDLDRDGAVVDVTYHFHDASPTEPFGASEFTQGTSTRRSLDALEAIIDSALTLYHETRKRRP